MKLVTTTLFANRYINDQVEAVKTAIKMIKQAGFDGFDLSLEKMLSNDSAFNIDHIKTAKEIKEYADGLNIKCYQAHAPFYHVFTEDDANKLYPYLVKSLEICNIIDCPILVIHPCNSLTDEQTHKLYFEKLIPIAEGLNVKIATENMYNWSFAENHCYPSACGTVERFNNQIDLAKSDYLVACVDIGHAEMKGPNYPMADVLIKSLGHDRVKCLHVHDNDLIHDEHTLPFHGNIKWDNVIKALKEIDYDGNFTFEADNFFKKYPFELVQSALNHMHDIGRYFIKRIKE